MSDISRLTNSYTRFINRERTYFVFVVKRASKYRCYQITARSMYQAVAHSVTFIEIALQEDDNVAIVIVPESKSKAGKSVFMMRKNENGEIRRLPAAYDCVKNPFAYLRDWHTFHRSSNFEG